MVTPGIDTAGRVVRIDGAESTELRPDMPVIVHGYDLGMNTWGGLGEYIRVPADWVVPLPEPLDAESAMAYGTAGFTAALSVERLQHAAGDAPFPPELPVVVSGASGGVGSVAVAMLAGLGCEVVAATGKAGDAASVGYLKRLGASEVVDRTSLEVDLKRPLAKARWAAGVDTTGGTILSSIVRSTAYRGAVTCCGLTQSAELPLSVYPFILRGVQLIGIDSAQTPIAVRRRVWERIAGDLRRPAIEESAQEIPLHRAPEVAAGLIDGTHRGRTIVAVTSQVP
ncbi:MAG: YhdH/YhfP family quinone oxidoreductase [Spirochaetales bacterium]|nr:YhdH/YhfP family quinone oxidoreductase [Spirochaetales bacterium]